MHRLHLPGSKIASAPAFTEPGAAEAWLAGLTPKSAGEAQAAILEQIEALDGSDLAPPQLITLLNLLRSAAVPRQAIAEVSFTRKPLPMAPDEERAFEVAQQLWTRLGIAYLRLTPKCTPANRCLPLHRAVLDAVIARDPARAEQAILVLIDGARKDIDQVLATRKRLPRISRPATQLKAVSL